MTGRIYDLAVLGGGPGGYVAAVRASRFGLKTVLVEMEELGGVCLNRGCIPTKALLRGAEVLSLVRRAEEFGIDVEIMNIEYSKAVERAGRVVKRLRKGVEFLLRKGGVEVIKGEGRLVSKDTLVIDGREVRARNIIVATGSRPMVPEGIDVDGRKVLTSDEALSLTELPSSMIVVGGGAIGVEFAYLFSTFGVRITILEAMAHILPDMDKEIALLLTRRLERMGIRVLTDSKILFIEQGEKVKLGFASPRGREVLEADTVLIAIGRVPQTDPGLEKLGIELDRGFVRTGDSMETTVPNIYAIGDVASPPLLAHKAMAEGILVAERIGGGRTFALDRSSIPFCIYTEPQVASIGLTEEKAREEGKRIKAGSFPFRANGKALAIGETEGFVKMVVDRDTNEVLGVHMIGPGVTELIGEVSLARALNSTPLKLSRIIHPHPTLSEALAEAAGVVWDGAIHI